MSSMKERDYDQSKYISLDLESFFRENDEFNMLKTLQEMYVSSYNLELEMKSLVTNELDSVLLCVDTILQMCNLIKQSKNNLDNISKMSNEYNYDVIFKEACKNIINIPNLEVNQLKSTLNNWMNNYNRELIENELYSSKHTHIDLNQLKTFQNYEDFLNKCKNVSIYIQSLVSEHLDGVTMNNYKLVKNNRLINSYELLFVKVPLLLSLLKSLGDFEYNSLTKETERTCEFCKNKLRSHCLTNLTTNNIQVLLESVSVLFMLDGKTRENISYVLKRRLELYNIATSSLASGSLAALIQLLSHFFANEVLLSVLSLFNKPATENSMFSESYESKLFEHLSSYSLIKMVQVKKLAMEKVNGMSIELNICDLNTKLPPIKHFIDSTFEKTWNRCVNDKISNSMLQIGISLNNYMKIKTDLGNFSDYFDNQDFVEDTKCDTESIIKELNDFLLTEHEFNQLVDSKLNSILEKINNDLKTREFKHTQMNSLSVYSIQTYNATFKSWISENGVLNSILLLNKFQPTFSLETMCGIISNKYLSPLINTAAQNIEFMVNKSANRSDQPGNNQPSTIDEDNKEIDTHNNKKESEQTQDADKQLYMVMVVYAASNLKSFINELGGYELCVFTKTLGELSVKMGMEYYINFIKKDLMPKSLELNKGSSEQIGANMPKKEYKRKPEDYCQMKPLRDCLSINNGKIEKCIKEVEIFEKTCDSNKPYFHSREGLDDSKSGLFTGKLHL